LAKTILVSSEGKHGIEAGVAALRGDTSRLDVIGRPADTVRWYYWTENMAEFAAEKTTVVGW